MLIWCQANAGTKFSSSRATKASLGPITKLPWELVTEIFSSLVDDICTFLACSLTCQLWCLAIVRRLHYSLATDENFLDPRGHKVLVARTARKLHELKLYSYARRVWICIWRRKPWFTPDRPNATCLTFSRSRTSRKLKYVIPTSQISCCVLNNGLEHLSPTHTLKQPICSSGQIVYFIGLSPNF
jgi:hypothetical protein